MNPTVTTQLAHADPNASPLTINELIDILNPLFSSVLGNSSFVFYVMQHGTPGVEDQDKAWIELDSAGRPLAVKVFFGGSWRRVYNGMIGEVRMFSGDPGDTTAWDTNGHGIIGGLYDGWQICNGKNGSIDLTDKFIVGAHMNNTGGHTGYNNGWQTFVDGKNDLKTGGSKDHMVVASDLPPFDAVAQSSKVTIHGFEAKETSPSHTNVSVLVDVHYSDLLPHDAVIGNYGSGPNDSPPVPQTPLPTLPPFYALAFIIFQGY